MAHNRRLSQFANTVGYDGGNIGINSLAPRSSLDISGDLTITKSSNDPSIIFDEHSGTDPKAKIQMDQTNSTNAELRFFTEGSGTLSERLRIESDGQFVINRSSGAILAESQSKLEIYNSTQNLIFVANSTAATDQDAGIMFAPANNVYGGKIIVTSDEDFSTGANRTAHMAFYTRKDGTASEKLRIESDGKVGVGINDPARLLHLHESNSNEALITFTTPTTGATSSDGFRVGMNGSEEALVWNNESGIIKFGTANTERLRITSSGKIQVTGTRAGTLQPSDDDTLELYTKATSGNVSTGGGITFYNHHGGGHVMGGVIHVVKANGVYENSSSDMLFGTRINGSSVAYRARLTSMGEWQTFSTSINIDISNTQSAGNNEAFIYARNGSTSMTAGTLAFRVYTNGNVSNTNNSYGSISDQNLKENIVDATSQWNDIKALQVRKYNFRENTGHQTHTQLGLIAQEVETVSPGLVETTDVREGETVLDADGNQLESIKSINYSVLYMKAVKTLQEAQTRIETLETQNADLLARVTALEGS